jgi:hypothetical protein
MRRLSLISIMLLLCIVAPLAAQDATPDTGWPIEQRCVGNPTPPPNDWTYDGTIFISDAIGIRALNAQVDSLYTVFERQDFIIGAAISPDGKWYAFPRGYSKQANSVSDHYVIDAIEVYSTQNPQISYEVPWDALFMYGNSPNYPVPAVNWVDSTHLVYSGVIKGEDNQYIVDPFTGQNKIIEGNIDWGTAKIAPDMSLAVYNDFIGFESKWGLYDLTSNTLVQYLEMGENIPVMPLYVPIQWFSDSSGFFAEVVTPSNVANLVQYERDGNLNQVIFSIENQMLGFHFSVSPNGGYVAVNNLNELYIVDLQQRQSWKTCLNIQGLAWSPDLQQLASTLDGDIVVLEIESWELNKVASNVGVVIAWGVAD